jgi:zinc transport system ATP-binding protein
VSDAPAVKVDNLNFSYDPTARVLENVSFTIDQGDFVCFVGPNGGGKTTLIKLLIGLLTPGQGRIRVLGQPPAKARRRVGYVPQSASLDASFPASVMDVVLMGRLGRTRRVAWYSRDDRQAALSALGEVDLADHRRRAFADLSGGQRQRVLIARALACQPDLLLLDEPTANLDVRVEQQFRQLLVDLNERLTIVLVSHDVGFVSEFVRKVVCVRRHVSVHPTEELTGDVLRDLYGQELRVVRHDHCGHEGHSHG